MQRAKFFAAAVILALAGAVYAGGNTQETASQAQAAKASCCAAKQGEHQGDAHHAHAAMSCDKDGKGCCGAGSCCAGGSCEKAQKGAATAVKTGADAEGGSCCASGAACCEGDKGCCGGAHKAGAHATNTAPASMKEGEGCCAGCGSGCCAAHKQGAGH
jgi:hypothetical protein